MRLRYTSCRICKVCTQTLAGKLLSRYFQDGCRAVSCNVTGLVTDCLLYMDIICLVIFVVETPKAKLNYKFWQCVKSFRKTMNLLSSLQKASFGSIEGLYLIRYSRWVQKISCLNSRTSSTLLGADFFRHTGTVYIVNPLRSGWFFTFF